MLSAATRAPRAMTVAQRYTWPPVKGNSESRRSSSNSVPTCTSPTARAGTRSTSRAPPDTTTSRPGSGSYPKLNQMYLVLRRGARVAPLVALRLSRFGPLVLGHVAEARPRPPRAASSRHHRPVVHRRLVEVLEVGQLEAPGRLPLQRRGVPRVPPGVLLRLGILGQREPLRESPLVLFC